MVRYVAFPVALLATIGLGAGEHGLAGTINGNIVAATSDANHKDFEVKVEADSNYTVDKPKDLPFDSGIIINNGKKTPPTNTAGNGTKTVTVTWTIAIANKDNVQAAVIGSTEGNLGKITYTGKFTDPTSVPDLGWQEDSLGNVSLANGDASDIAFSNLGFFVAPSGVLTLQEIDAFLAGTLPLTPATVPSGDVLAGDTLFVDTFSPGAALIAGFDASYVDLGFSPVSAHDGLLTASAITVPEPGTLTLIGVGLAGLRAMRRRNRSSRGATAV